MKWIVWAAYLCALWFALPDALRARIDLPARLAFEAQARVNGLCRAFPEQMAFWLARRDCMRFAQRERTRVVSSQFDLPALARVARVVPPPSSPDERSAVEADHRAMQPDALRLAGAGAWRIRGHGDGAGHGVDDGDGPAVPLGSPVMLLAQAADGAAGVPAAPLTEPGGARAAAGSTPAASKPAASASNAAKPAALAAPAIPAAPAAYVDQLMSGAQSEDAAVDPRSAAPQPQGRRAGSLTYRVDDRRPAGGGTIREQGVEYRYSRETESLGAFDLTMAARNLGQFGALAPLPGTPGADIASTLGRFTLAQSRFALSEKWLMDNTLGVLPAFGPALLSGGYRVSLPVSQIEGVTSRIYNDDTEWSVVSGKPGAFTGATGYGFQTGKALLSGIGGATRFSPALRAGAQVWTLSGHATVANHTTVALTAEQQFALARLRVKPIVVIDDRGKTGAWLDGEWQGASSLQRAGLYRSARGLLWTDLSIVTDQQGAYWRGDWRGIARTVSAGTEYTETNLARARTLSGARALSVFANLTQRFSRDVTAGGGATARINRPPGETLNAMASHQLTLNGFAAVRTALGQSRIGVNWLNDVQSGGDRNTSQALRWDQEWLLWERLHVSTNAGYSVDTAPVAGATQRRDLALSVSSAGQGRLYWDSSVSLSAVKADTGTSSHSGNAALNLNWALDPGWTGAIGVQVVRAGAVAATQPGTEPRPHDLRVMATLRYDFASGVPFDSTGYRTGAYGSGSIEGQVFFDENRDGTRQPNENAAANLTVILDQRHIAVTDANGRFSFRLVPAGDHQIDLIRDRLPLPWELRNPQALRVTVPVRDVARPAIALTRID